MTVLNDIKRVYFLGIGGIGMSALARYFNREGMIVAGYDRTSSPLTQMLHSENIAIHYNDSSKLIPEAFRSPEGTIIVYTPAVPGNLQELVFFRNRGHKIYKRSEILGILSRLKQTVSVAGTHGKTTVSTMLAYLLSLTNAGCNAFLGGISKNFNSNLVYRPESSLMITEADEFDRSFLQLHPFAAIITAIDPDHLDIYGSAHEMQQAYSTFASQIEENGILLIKKDIPLNINAVRSGIFTYSLYEGADFHARNIKLQGTKYQFDLQGPDLNISNITLAHPGLVNVENAVAAISMASMLGVDPVVIRKGMESFTGIQRRFDIQVVKKDIVYIDDYGHHPKEIEATISSVRALYPGKKITGIFQPHLFSRTRDFADGFAKSLGLLDELILLDIYPAREIPIPGITSDIILKNVTLEHKILCRDEQLLDELKERNIDVLLTMGAGNIDRFVEIIRKHYA